MDLCITDNLIFMRHKHGYTMEALAEIISVSRQTVAKWESGESYPDIMNCMKLATLYKITLDELVYKPLSEANAGEFSSDENKIFKSDSFIISIIPAGVQGKNFGLPMVILPTLYG